MDNPNTPNWLSIICLDLGVGAAETSTVTFAETSGASSTRTSAFDCRSFSLDIKKSMK